MDILETIYQIIIFCLPFVLYFIFITIILYKIILPLLCLPSVLYEMIIEIIEYFRIKRYHYTKKYYKIVEKEEI